MNTPWRAGEKDRVSAGQIEVILNLEAPRRGHGLHSSAGIPGELREVIRGRRVRRSHVLSVLSCGSGIHDFGPLDGDFLLRIKPRSDTLCQPPEEPADTRFSTHRETRHFARVRACLTPRCCS